MIITTGGKANQQSVQNALALADKYGYPYIDRDKQNIDTLFNTYQTDIVITGKEKLTVIPFSTKKPIYFHPSLSMIRAKRLIKGEKDTFIEAAGIEEGLSVLDCTMGLASDSIIASMVTTARGTVTALEANALLYMMVTEGLKIYHSDVSEFGEAMRRIKTIHVNHTDYLKSLPDNSIDVVYFDPMFQETIESSSSIRKINQQTLKTDLVLETIEEARRVAKKRVVLKDHWKSERFKKLGFKQMKRKNSQIHYGYIDITN